jgi:putative transposase
VIGRKRISKEVRDLIFRMVTENPTWGAPRVHGELLMLGFDVSERTISRWMKRAPRNPEPAKRWLAFLRNHRETIAAMDFFTVPTITFGVLYCFFVISHDRRRILHFNVTRHPTSAWIIQQLREAFPYGSGPRFLIFDRDGKYGSEVPIAVRSTSLTPVQSSFESPWQNGVAKRWIESARRDLLDHVIAINETHLKRLLSEYVRYYHEDRTHLGLDKQTPGNRGRTTMRGRVTAFPRLGALHAWPRYRVSEARRPPSPLRTRCLEVHRSSHVGPVVDFGWEPHAFGMPRRQYRLQENVREVEQNPQIGKVHSLIFSIFEAG